MHRSAKGEWEQRSLWGLAKPSPNWPSGRADGLVDLLVLPQPWIAIDSLTGSPWRPGVGKSQGELSFLHATRLQAQLTEICRAWADEVIWIIWVIRAISYFQKARRFGG